MVNVLKLRTLVTCLKNLNKQCRPRSDCLWRSSVIRVFPVCYPDKRVVNSSPENQHFIWEQKEKSVRNLKHLQYSSIRTGDPTCNWWSSVNRYNHASTNLAFHSSGTSQHKLSIHKTIGSLLLSFWCMTNFMKTCSYLHASFTETIKIIEKFVKKVYDAQPVNISW